MVVMDELHGDATPEDLLASAGNLQSFFDQLELEVAAAGRDEAVEEDLEWLSNKDAFPTVDTMEMVPTFIGSPTKVVVRRRQRADDELERQPNKHAFLEVETAQPKPDITKVYRRRRRAGEGLDGLLNKDAVPEVRMVDPEPAVTKAVRRRRRRRRADEELDWLPNKDAFLEVETAEAETAVMKMLLRRRWAGTSTAPTAAYQEHRRRRHADEELESMPNKDAYMEVETAETQPAVKNVVRRRLRRRAKEELDWLPNKNSFLEVDMWEPETAVMKMVLRRRRAGALIAPTAANRGQRRDDEELESMPNKGGYLEVETAETQPAVKKVVRRRLRRRAKEDLDWLPNKNSFLEVEMSEPETLVTKMVRRRRRAGTLIAPTAANRGQRRGDEELEWMPNKGAYLEVETAETQPAVKKVVRRRQRGRAKEELEWLPKKNSFLEVEVSEPEPTLTKMVFWRRRAGASVAPTAAKPRQRRCSHCGRRKTAHWRAGPEGPRTLCNACGRRYRSERLVPEYRPFSSAIFRWARELHSSMPRRIVEMCRSSPTLVDVVVRSASPTDHLSRSPPRTKEAVCKTSRKPFGGDLQASTDHEGLEVAAGGGGGSEEQVEWPSNEEALQVLVTMEPQPSMVEPRVKEVVRQWRRAAEPGHQWCQHCGSRKKPQWRVGLAEEDEERDWLLNKNVPAMKTMEPKPSVLVRPTRRGSCVDPLASGGGCAGTTAVLALWYDGDTALVRGVHATVNFASHFHLQPLDRSKNLLPAISC